MFSHDSLFFLFSFHSWASTTQRTLRFFLIPLFPGKASSTGEPRLTVSPRFQHPFRLCTQEHQSVSKLLSFCEDNSHRKLPLRRVEAIATSRCSATTASFSYTLSTIQVSTNQILLMNVQIPLDIYSKHAFFRTNTVKCVLITYADSFDS